ncbi:hypothetical protein HMI54_013940, partial [Coelomomyces lativittatus]
QSIEKPKPSQSQFEVVNVLVEYLQEQLIQRSTALRIEDSEKRTPLSLSPGFLHSLLQYQQRPTLKVFQYFAEELDAKIDDYRGMQDNCIRILTFMVSLMIILAFRNQVDEVTLFWAACECGCYDIIEWLLKVKQPNVNYQTPNSKQTPLHRLIINGDAKSLKLLLQQPYLDVNIPDNDGNTPLFLCESIDCLQLMLEDQRTNLSVMNDQGK